MERKRTRKACCQFAQKNPDEFVKFVENFSDKIS